jgi:hypothetical protein
MKVALLEGCGVDQTLWTDINSMIKMALLDERCEMH